jgi:hypothetical protein
MKADHNVGDELRKLIAKRTGLKSQELSCPREKSDMTPCIARDGGLAVADGFSLGVCVGCGADLQSLFETEKSKHLDQAEPVARPT